LDLRLTYRVAKINWNLAEIARTNKDSSGGVWLTQTYVFFFLFFFTLIFCQIFLSLVFFVIYTWVKILLLWFSLINLLYSFFFIYLSNLFTGCSLFILSPILYHLFRFILIFQSLGLLSYLSYSCGKKVVKILF
jgi:hypothetical protein